MDLQITLIIAATIIVIITWVSMRTTVLPPEPAAKSAEAAVVVSMANQQLNNTLVSNVSQVNALQAKIADLDSYLAKNPDQTASVAVLKAALLAELSNIENNNIGITAIAEANEYVAEMTDVPTVPVSGFAAFNPGYRAMLYIRGRREGAEMTNEVRSDNSLAIPTNQGVRNIDLPIGRDSHLDTEHSPDESRGQQRAAEVRRERTPVKSKADLAKIKEKKNVKLVRPEELLRKKKVVKPVKTIDERNAERRARGKPVISPDSIESRRANIAKFKESLLEHKANIERLVEKSTKAPLVQPDVAHLRNYRRQAEVLAEKIKNQAAQMASEQKILDDAAVGLATEDEVLSSDDSQAIVLANQDVALALQESADHSSALINNAVDSILDQSMSVDAATALVVENSENPQTASTSELAVPESVDAALQMAA
jgi:hypothetical protein